MRAAAQEGTVWGHDAVPNRPPRHLSASISSRSTRASPARLLSSSALACSPRASCSKRLQRARSSSFPLSNLQASYNQHPMGTLCPPPPPSPPGTHL